MDAADQPSVESASISRWTIHPAVLAGFAVAMLFLLGGGVAALREQAETFRAGDRARISLFAMLQIGRLRDALTEAESGQRGYLLTGDEAYVAPYERGMAQLSGDLARLRELTQDLPNQQDRLGALEASIRTRSNDLRDTVELRRTRGQAAAVEVMRTDAGTTAMEDIRRRLDELESDESRKLGEMLADRSIGRARTLSMIVTVTGCAVLAMLGSLVLLARTDRARRRAQAHVREAEERLRIALSQKLADSETRARAVLDTTVSAIISIDEGGRIGTFNKAAERLFGYEVAEVLGRNVSLLMPAPYRAEHDGYLRRYLETGEGRIIGSSREVTGLRKDGTTFPMTIAVGDAVLQGRHVFTGVVHDLTREKEAEERERKLLKQALQNERLADVGAMTAQIAHDFGNPLAGLRMMAERFLMLLGRDPVPVDRLREAADVIVGTADRLNNLVGEFKDFAREQRLHLRDVELPAFVREVAEAWRHEARGRDIALEVDVGAAPSIRADPDKLRRVMDNLLKNALEAIDCLPGAIRVAVESNGAERVRIRVEDTGPGVPDGTDVFAMFETTKATGTGLGLAICKQIVLAHGGNIEHVRRAPAGTVFLVDLPIRSPSSPS